MAVDRRMFLKLGGTAALASGLPACSGTDTPATPRSGGAVANDPESAGHVDYTLRVDASPIEIGPDRIVSMATYNGQFPGPLLRFSEGRRVEEGTSFIPAHGKRRLVFTPGPAGFRFYHTHNRAGANLGAGQYGGQVGPVYVEPKRNAGRYDREIFLVLKEFEPSFSQGGDMAQDVLAGSEDYELKRIGETAMQASLAKEMPHGYGVGVCQGQRGARWIQPLDHQRRGVSDDGGDPVGVDPCPAGPALSSPDAERE